MKKTILILLLAVLGLTACGNVGETGPNEVAVWTEDGDFQAEKIQDECLGPETYERKGMGDKFYTYWNDQRYIDFSGGDGSEAAPIQVSDKDGVLLSIPGRVTFTLNTNCEVLQEFHTRIGIKHAAWEGDGWMEMLRLYVLQPLQKALNDEAQKYTWRQLLQDQAIRDKWESDAGALARELSAQAVGGSQEYFCSPSYTGEGECGDFFVEVQKPGLPESVANALAETAAEVERQQQATAAQSRINVEAETLRALTEVLGAEYAVLYMAMKEGEIQVMPLPFGSDLNMNPPAAE
ncbi:MAG TPA: SPFH domain-containing protein [Gammaproteobacteria bacterium]|nr:SPFH domain-containing protein [Gammaproteobacteria bacterium]